MIPLFKVHVPANIGQVIQEVFETGFITEGKQTDEFEQELAERFQNPYTAVVNSGTSALTLAYKLAGVGPGTEVISSPMTCMATNEPIQTLGGNIVWADIDPQTGNIDPQSVARKITEKTVAVSAVHWSGLPFNLEEINRVCRSANPKIKIIEDAAHAFGASYHGHTIGSNHGLSDYCCFSFQAIKHLTTVDGGAITVHNEDDHARIKRLRWFGLDRKFKGDKWSQDVTESGFKFHMNNINAVIGLEQLCYVDSLIQSHISNGQYFDAKISNPKVRPLVQDPLSTSSYWIYTVVVDDRDAFKKHMADNDIACDIVHYRNDKYSTFSSFSNDNLPGVDYFCSHMINIPVGWWLTSSQRDLIVSAINSFR